MIPRRALLASAGALALLAGAAPFAAAGGGPGAAAVRGRALHRIGTAVFGDVGAAVRIGRACRAAGIAPSRPPALAAPVAGTDAEAGAAARRVAAAARADYAAGRVRIVGGWVLSATETDLCGALADAWTSADAGS